MSLDDEQFEQQLRDFRPRTAPELRLPHRRTAFVAAAAVAACLIAAVLLSYRGRPLADPPLPETKRGRPITLMQLESAARNDQLESALDRSAQRMLPSTVHPRTALNTLAKD